MKNISKTQIQTVLKTLNPTKIFQIAKLFGIDVSYRANVYKFICKYATTKKVEKRAADLSYHSGSFKDKRYCYKKLNLPIAEVVAYARYQIKTKVSNNYFKPLVEGNKNIYWGYHNDYNKSIAMPNTETNRVVMAKINLLLNKHLK